MKIKAWFDNLVDGIGYVIIRMAPIIAAFPAAITILKASGYTLDAWIKVGGIELMGYAIGHAAVTMIRSKTITIRQAVYAVGIYGLVIEGMLIGYDVLPAWEAFMNGTSDFATATQASVSMLLPAFTVAGAALYAFWQWNEQQSKHKEEDRSRTVAIEEQRAAIDIEMYRKEREQDLELRYQKEETANRIKEQKAVAKLSDHTPGSISTGGRSNKNTSTESVGKVSSDGIGKQLVLYYKGNPGAKLEDAAKHVGWSVPVVSREISTLVEAGVFHAVKDGRRKVVTVNGSHEEYLAS